MGRKATAKEIMETNLLGDIAVELRSRRRQLGLTMEDVSQAAGISRVTLHRIERGETSVSAGALASVAKCLGAPLTTKSSMRAGLPDEILIGDYPGLASLAWQLDKDQKLSLYEAWSIYARNWRHLDQSNLLDNERELITSLNQDFGGPHV